MTKSEERRWREYYAREARYHWIEFPCELLGVCTAIIGCTDYTPARKVKQMQWAMEAYNEAMKEASSNAEKI